MALFYFLQNVDINEKINAAPDSSYKIGVFIGSLLPFIILVAIAYFIYRYNKNKIKKE